MAKNSENPGLKKNSPQNMGYNLDITSNNGSLTSKCFYLPENQTLNNRPRKSLNYLTPAEVMANYVTFGKLVHLQMKWASFYLQIYNSVALSVKMGPDK